MLDNVKLFEFDRNFDNQFIIGTDEEFGILKYVITDKYFPIKIKNKHNMIKIYCKTALNMI